MEMSQFRTRWSGIVLCFRRLVGAALVLLLLVSSALFAAEQSPDKTAADHYYEPLPQETGKNGLKLMLRKLQTTARLMQVTAHPDDEDGGMLTLEARGKGVSTLLMTLTRGEGGQNKLGSNLFDVLGVLRTLELLASDRYYGVEQRFSRVADFGYSKTAEETFNKWQGHDVALGDMVRVIRTFRPDVLIARFSGTERDGHGHHQASAMLTKEAFRAAADPKRFPEQIAEGLQPWQAKKLYSGNVCGFFASTCDAANYTVKMNTGVNDPVLGTSYIQFAMKGLRHQLSQGSGAWTVEPGDRYTYYKLLDSAVASPKDNDGHEQDLFDGVNVQLPGLVGRLGDEDEKKVPGLRTDLTRAANHIREAWRTPEDDLQKAAGPLFDAKRLLEKAIETLERAPISGPAKEDVLAILREKQEQATEAIALALNVSTEAWVANAAGSAGSHLTEANAGTVVSPGQQFTVRIKFHNGSKYPLAVSRFWIDGPGNWVERIESETGVVPPGKDHFGNILLRVPEDVAELTRPYWHRDNPETDSLNEIDDERYVTLPFANNDLRAHVSYHVTGRQDLTIVGWNVRNADGPASTISAPVLVQFLDDKGERQVRRPAVVPMFSVEVDPNEQVIPLANVGARDVRVDAEYNGMQSAMDDLRLIVPTPWHVQPQTAPIAFEKRGQKKDFNFQVVPQDLQEGRSRIRADLQIAGKKFSEGYTLVTRDDLGAAYYYQPAVQRVSVVDVKVPKEVKVGYIVGAGDEIPPVLQQIGLNVNLISAEQLATGDLSVYQTIVLGIRAYDTRKDLIEHNKRLLDYVAAGGRLVVQYNASANEFNSGKFAPYPLTLSRARVSVEEALVTILDSANPIFHAPNEITQKDFEGWVQERGLYFASQWDSKFNPLLESHDPGEIEQKGGLLIAQYGKGTYIYTGYAFFRQLPAGVPGAVRLFVNLLSHE